MRPRKIPKPEDKELKKRWDKILEREGVGHLPAERVYVEISNRVKETDNSWRAGEEAAGRHLISNSVWQTQVPEWANNNTLVLQVLQARFPRLDWNDLNGHFSRSLVGRWAGAIQLVWRQGLTSAAAARQLGIKPGDLRKSLSRIRRYGDKVLNS